MKGSSVMELKASSIVMNFIEDGPTCKGSDENVLIRDGID